MKKKIKLFLSSVVFICGIFTSCENLLSVKEEKQTEQSYIRISTNLSSVDRSVLPSDSFKENTTGLTWTLSGSRNGTAEITIKVWNDEGDTATITQTAYQKMINDSFIPVDEGTWIFTLTAKNNSGKVLEATKEKTINGGENTLDFDMKEAVGKGAASGQIEFTLKWKELGVVGNVAITLSKRNDSSFKNIEVNYEKSASQDYEYVNFFAGTDDSPLEAGSYMLKMELRQQTGFSDSTEATSGAPIYETINTYTCLIHVAPGLCSKGEVTLDTLAPLYKVIFKGTEDIEFKESIVSLSYNAYTTFALPTIQEEDGYEYQWHKTGDDPDTGLNIDEFIEDPLKVCINENAYTFVLYRYKIVDKNDIVRTAKGDSTTGDYFSIGTAEGLGIFRDLVNGCNENLKMVDNSEGSEKVFVYYETGSSKSQLNATLTSDIDLTQLKDADGDELSWVPINGYSGTFDGGDHTITVNNTYQVNGNRYYQGFFDTLDGATIKNLVVAGEETISESGLDYCGGIASQIKNQRGVNTTFENCVNKRNITVSAVVKGIGGFAGYTSSNNSETTNFVNCINLGTIENNYNASEYYEPYVAGFTSGATSYTKCINAGNVTGATFAVDETTIFGTVAGFDANASASFTDCINLGNISANSYTFSDGKFCSTEKVYGFSSIENETNKPSFTNCIDAGSAKNKMGIGYPFTGFVDNTIGEYKTCYYNSDSYSSSSSYNAVAKTSDDLCQLTDNDLPGWDFVTSRYPLPKIEDNFSNEIWQEVEAKAIPKVSNFEMLQNRIASANGTADNPEVIVLNSDIVITETLGIKTYIKIVSTGGNYSLIRGNDFSETLFNVGNGGSLTLGDGTANIILDGGSTDEALIEATAPLIMSSGSLTLNNCTLQNNNNSNATETGTGIYLQINDTSSLCSFNDVSFGKNSLDDIPHIKIENNTSGKFTFNLGGSLEGGVPSIDMPSTTCINITESLEILDGESIKITLDEYTIGNRIISANEGINLVRENFSLTTTDVSWFIDSAGYLVGGSVIAPDISENGEFEVSSFENLLWIALGLKNGDITSFNMKLTDDIVIPSGEWQFYQLNVSNSSTIDGQGHSITIKEDVSKFGNDAGGLFYKFNNSTVKNLVLKGSITANTSDSGYIGALCRSAYRTTIQNVMSTVEIIDEGSGNAGGLVGYFGGNKGDDGDAAHIPGSFIQNCAVYANIKSTNGTVGGLVGCTWSGYRCWQINNCIYAGTVTGGTDQGVGAIIGTHKTGRTSTFKDTWYCANATSEIVGKYDNEENGENFNDYDGTVISKTADQIATAEAAVLLNTNSDGTVNDVWKYVEGEAAYPTLKIVN